MTKAVILDGFDRADGPLGGTTTETGDAGWSGDDFAIVDGTVRYTAYTPSWDTLASVASPVPLWEGGRPIRGVESVSVSLTSFEVPEGSSWHQFLLRASGVAAYFTIRRQDNAIGVVVSTGGGNRIIIPAPDAPFESNVIKNAWTPGEPVRLTLHYDRATGTAQVTVDDHPPMSGTFEGWVRDALAGFEQPVGFGFYVPDSGYVDDFEVRGSWGPDDPDPVEAAPWLRLFPRTPHRMVPTVTTEIGRGVRMGGSGWQ